MKKGFTMIELIFVIVILGILASVAIPRLAATRDDARAATIKTDVGTALNAIPAWFQGQQDVRIPQAMSIDTSVWTRASDVEYTWNDNTACVTIAIWDINTTATVDAAAAVAVAGTDYNATGGWVSTHGAPVLRIIRGTGVTGSVCDLLWNNMGLSEQNITLTGRGIRW